MKHPHHILWATLISYYNEGILRFCYSHALRGPLGSSVCNEITLQRILSSLGQPVEKPQMSQMQLCVPVLLGMLAWCR